MYTVEEREAADLLSKKIRDFISDTIRQCRKDKKPAPGYDDIRYVVMLTHIAHLEMRILKLENGLGSEPVGGIGDVYKLLNNALSQLEHGIDTADPYSDSHIIRALHQRLSIAKYNLVRGMDLLKGLSIENFKADDSTQP